jgi:hypothetical protein
MMVEQVEEQYKVNAQDFTRNRALPFPRLVVLLLHLTRKSLTVELHRFFGLFSPVKAISKSAFCQARQKLKPAYLKMLTSQVCQQFYTDNDERVKTWQGLRLLAIDSSVIDLPYTPELVAVYGTYSNQHPTKQVKGRISVLYDLLNHLVLDGIQQAHKMPERDLAYQHLVQAGAGDLVIYDRGYACHDLFIQHVEQQTPFLARLSLTYNTPVKAFLAAGLPEQQVIFLPPQKKQNAHQPPVPVRLIRVELDQQVEVLATSLLDEQKYPIAGFAALYSQRWGVETCFDVLKNVLVLENFSGYSQQAVEQDFYSCLFLLNMKALLQEELEEQLHARYSHRQHTYQLNTAVALSLLKDQIAELFMQQEPQAILDKLRTVMLEHVEPVRKGRKYERKKRWYHVPKLKKNRKS